MKRCPKCGKSYPDEANFCPVDAGRLVTVATDVIATQPPGGDGLVGGRFQLGPMIGGSATGEVHRATDLGSPPGDSAGRGGAVAVKLVAPQVLAIPQIAQRIERELKQLERVQHGGVARVLASGRHGDRVFVATELIEGARPLGELVVASGPVDPQRASELVLAIGEALIEAAKMGVVHRDLAPKNILVTPDSLRLINFAVPTPGRIPGVPEFVAPEVLEGKPVDQRSNIYSLAAIYAFLLTGRVAPGEAPSKLAAVPADVDALVVRALDRNPAKRYLTLRQFLDEVERMAHGPEGGTGTTAPFGRAGKSKELSSTLMGFGFNKDALQQKTPLVELHASPEAAPQPPSAPVAAPAPLGASTPVSNATAMGVPSAPQAESPWVRPPQGTPAPEYAPPPIAPAPVHGPMAAPLPSAPPPNVAAPKVSPGTSGKKRADQPENTKGKFRETMWFKKGELDVAAAEEAAAAGDAAAAGKADLLPIEERYTDDGSITRGDAEKYSLKTGATSMMPAMRDTSPSASVSERELVGEMKGGRNVVIAVIVVAIIIAIGIVAAFVV